MRKHPHMKINIKIAKKSWNSSKWTLLYRSCWATFEWANQKMNAHIASSCVPAMEWNFTCCVSGARIKSHMYPEITLCIVSIMQMVCFFSVDTQQKSYLVWQLYYDGKSGLRKSIQRIASQCNVYKEKQNVRKENMYKHKISNLGLTVLTSLSLGEYKKGLVWYHFYCKDFTLG